MTHCAVTSVHCAFVNMLSSRYLCRYLSQEENAALWSNIKQSCIEFGVGGEREDTDSVFSHFKIPWMFLRLFW